jgi:hypothetical protein
MTSPAELFEAVREAWDVVPAPPAEDLQYMEWGWGEEAARAFVGVRPVDVDIESHGFYAATPLLDLPPRAAAAYLGTYLMSLLKGLQLQQLSGVFDDVLTRAHTLTCLSLPSFWERVSSLLTPDCHRVLVEVVGYLTTMKTELALTDQQVDIMAAEIGTSA